MTLNPLKKGLRIQGIWHANNKHTHFVIGSYEIQHLYIDHNTSSEQSSESEMNVEHRKNTSKC